MKIILHKLLVVVFVGLFTNTLVAKEYKVAIFDYDIREKNKQSVAKYIEEKLLKSGLEFSNIDQFTGLERDDVSISVLKKLENDNYDLIISITSDAMGPAEYRLKTTPWLFTNVNNPKFFGIGNYKYPGGNRSGVTYYVDSLKQLSFFNEILNGKLKKIGLIFDHHAKSRPAELHDFRRAAIKLKMKHIIKVIQKKEELPLIVNEMIAKKVDAILLTSSGKLYNNIDLILNQSTQAKIPIFSVNRKGVPNGALSALSSDYYKMVDENLISMVIDVLKYGKDPGTLPIQHLKNPLIYINQTQSNKLGIIIPNAIKNKAAVTY